MQPIQIDSEKALLDTVRNLQLHNGNLTDTVRRLEMELQQREDQVQQMQQQEAQDANYRDERIQRLERERDRMHQRFEELRHLQEQEEADRQQRLQKHQEQQEPPPPPQSFFPSRSRMDAATTTTTVQQQDSESDMRSPSPERQQRKARFATEKRGAQTERRLNTPSSSTTELERSRVIVQEQRNRIRELEAALQAEREREGSDGLRVGLLAENGRLRRETHASLKALQSLQRDIKLLLDEGKPIQEVVEEAVEEQHRSERAVEKFLHIAENEAAGKSREEMAVPQTAELLKHMKDTTINIRFELTGLMDAFRNLVSKETSIRQHLNNEQRNWQLENKRLVEELQYKTNELEQFEQLHVERSARLEADAYKKEERLRITVQQLEEQLGETREQVRQVTERLEQSGKREEMLKIDLQATQRACEEYRMSRDTVTVELLRLKEELRQLKIAHTLAESMYEKNAVSFKKSLVKATRIASDPEVDNEALEAEINIEANLKNEKGELNLKAMLLALKAKMEMYRERYITERTLLKQRDMLLRQKEQDYERNLAHLQSTTHSRDEFETVRTKGELTEQKLREAKKELAVREEVTKELRERVRELTAVMEELDKELGRQKDLVKNAKVDLNRRDTIIKNLKAKLEAIEKVESEAARVKSDAEIKVKCLSANLSSKEAIIKDLRSRIQGTREKTAAHKALTEELMAVKLQLEEAKKELSVKVKRTNTLSEQLREAMQENRRIKEFQQNHNISAEEYEAVHQQVERLENRVNALQLDRERLKRRCDSFSAAIERFSETRNMQALLKVEELPEQQTNRSLVEVDPSIKDTVEEISRSILNVSFDEISVAGGETAVDPRILLRATSPAKKNKLKFILAKESFAEDLVDYLMETQ